MSAEPIPSLINRLPVRPTLTLNFDQHGNDIDNFTPAMHMVESDVPGSEEIPVEIINISNNANTHENQRDNVQVHNVPLENQPLYEVPYVPEYMPSYPQGIQGQPFQELPYGPPPFHVPPPIIYNQPLMDTPLQFGPQPPPVYTPGNMMMQPGDMGLMRNDVSMQHINPQFGVMNHPASSDVQIPADVMITVQNSPKEVDLREELARKRQAAENLRKNKSTREEYDKTVERRVMEKDGNDSDSWSRKVFVAESEDSMGNAAGKTVTDSEDKSQDLREKLRQKDVSKEPKRRDPPGRLNQRLSPNVEHRRRSPHVDRRRMSPERNRTRDGSRETIRSRGKEGRIIRQRDTSHERRTVHGSAREDFSGNQIEAFRSRSRSPRRSPVPHRRNPSPAVRFRDLWDNIPIGLSETIFMYKYVRQDSTAETDPYALLRATKSLSFDVDFDFVKEQTAIEEWYVCVELVTDITSLRPLVGEGLARTKEEATFRAAEHAVDTIQKACRVIEPNFGYFAEGGVPDFIARRCPMKTSVYEIIQNMDPGQPLAVYTIEMMFKMFLTSEMEDLFFLATDFSYLERTLVIEIARKMSLWWRLFGIRHPDARPDDIVSTQHVCVYKQRTALQLVRQLLANGGSTQKYTLVDPREYRLTRPRVEHALR